MAISSIQNVGNGHFRDSNFVLFMLINIAFIKINAKREGGHRLPPLPPMDAPLKCMGNQQESNLAITANE